ncbi:MAG: hypothetical protein U9N10_00240 [Bacillota bacterium]|nr:hypothetical protein [Bacillota bacterium]
MKKKIGIAIVVVFIIGLSVILNIDKLIPILMDIEYAKFEVTGDTAIMTGVINTGTPKDVEDLIKKHPNLKTIIMKNVPGSIDDIANLEASRLIRKYGLNTHVPSDGMIASGGTDFFCAGVKRTIENGAEIGVHSWASGDIEDASKLSRNHPEHKKYLDYYNEMDILEDFYWFTIEAAPASDIYIMNKDEMEKYKLINK